eukprot:scaffold79832_cov67-Phaeocystis_antarctica.AAC.2
MSKGAKTSGAKAVSMIFVKFLAVAHASSARRGAVLTLECLVLRVSCVFRLFNTLGIFCQCRGGKVLGSMRRDAGGQSSKQAHC